MGELRKKKLAAVDTDGCVACGCCVAACRPGAIRVFYGMYATVDAGKCVGCGACGRACPAGVISLQEAGR